MRLLAAAALALAMTFPAFAQDYANPGCPTAEEATAVATEKGWTVIGVTPTADGRSVFVFSGDRGTFAAEIIDGCVQSEGDLIGPPIKIVPPAGA